MRAAATLRRLTADRVGASMVEFALALPVLMVCVAGMANVIQRLSVTTQVQSASEAGVRYASKSGFDAAAITQVVESASSHPNIKADPAPAKACICWQGNSGKAHTVVCGSTCLNGSTPVNYAIVSAKVSYTDPFPFLKLTNSNTVTAETWTRLQ